MKDEAAAFFQITAASTHLPTTQQKAPVKDEGFCLQANEQPVQTQ